MLIYKERLDSILAKGSPVGTELGPASSHPSLTRPQCPSLKAGVDFLPPALDELRGGDLGEWGLTPWLHERWGSTHLPVGASAEEAMAASEHRTQGSTLPGPLS